MNERRACEMRNAKSALLRVSRRSGGLWWVWVVPPGGAGGPLANLRLGTGTGGTSTVQVQACRERRPRLTRRSRLGDAVGLNDKHPRGSSVPDKQFVRGRSSNVIRYSVFYILYSIFCILSFAFCIRRRPVPRRPHTSEVLHPGHRYLSYVLFCSDQLDNGCRARGN